MMTNEIPALVFGSEAGDYFLVPRETFERCRATAEQKAQIEHLIASPDDVSGFGFGSLDLSQFGGSLSFRFEVILCPPPPDQGIRPSPLPDRLTARTG